MNEFNQIVDYKLNTSDFDMLINAVPSGRTDQQLRLEMYNRIHWVESAKSWKSIEKIDEIAKLENNWNGYGAMSFSEEVVCLAKRIVKNLNKQPDIYPTGRGTIQIQYELDNRSYIEFEIFENEIKSLEIPFGEYSEAKMRTIKAENYEDVNITIEKFYEQYSAERREIIQSNKTVSTDDSIRRWENNIGAFQRSFRSFGGQRRFAYG